MARRFFFFFPTCRSASDIRHNQGMEEKSFEETARRARTSGLPSLDGFSLREDDLLRISRPIGGNAWKEYSISFGELVGAVGIWLRGSNA